MLCQHFCQTPYLVVGTQLDYIIVISKKRNTPAFRSCQFLLSGHLSRAGAGNFKSALNVSCNTSCSIQGERTNGEVWNKKMPAKRARICHALR
ncbi:hypothetical protein HMPREF3198_01100 [Winkia neuii]|nr:hypothetical protein HMPREF3198_01100 [Winkia neuii]